jgi:uncharacterized protein YbjT (DUF2867 family)
MGDSPTDDPGPVDRRRVLVAGATGGTGRAVLDCLEARDVIVRGTTSTAANRETLAELGVDEAVVCDLFDTDDATDAVEDCDAVLCTVGTSPGLEMLFGDLVDGPGVCNLVDAAAEAGVERFVLISSIGVGDSRPGLPIPFRALLSLTGILGAKEASEAHLRDSGLAYTILRPGSLTDDDATGDVVVAEGGDTISGSIPRADVARLAVAALDTPAAEGRTIEIVSREGLRGEKRGVIDIEWAPWNEPTADS